MVVQVGGLLYSLLHLGGFAGDVAHYTQGCAGSTRVLELGCGEGRLAMALARSSEYVGIDCCAEFVAKARGRLAGLASASTVPAVFLEADFLEPVCTPSSFDAVVLSANVLFCCATHKALLNRCADALQPGGKLLLDVYNAQPWHEVSALGGEHPEGAHGDMLVSVTDEEGTDWRVFERDPQVDTAQQRIICCYDFVPSGPIAAAPISESLVHHYLLPDELLWLLSKHSFDVEEVWGDFFHAPFDARSSEHLVVTARRRGGST